MTEQEMKEALTNAGATDIGVTSQPFDYGDRVGVMVSCLIGGQRHRAAVRVAPDTPVESVYPTLLKWVLNPSDRLAGA